MNSRFNSFEDAHQARQLMTDALARGVSQEQSIPSALRILGRMFHADDCALYEHRCENLVRLKYRMVDGFVYGPEAIRALCDDHEFAAMKGLEAGFEIPDAQFGVPCRQRVRATVLLPTDERTPAPWSVLVRSKSCIIELNIPLVIAGKANGFVAIQRNADFVYIQSEIELAELMAQQLALSMEYQQLRDKSSREPSCQRRESQTDTDADETAGADYALQRTTDALANLPDLDNFVPAVLSIVAEIFKTKDCAYFEHRRGDPIRLCYWFFNNHVLSPAEIASLEGEEFAFMRQLERGFKVPDTYYFGVPFRLRTRATIIDHTKVKFPSVFNEFCISRGWNLELNVPLVVAGEADGALVIYRKAGDTYSSSEILLSERLGQQLALAMEASRLSTLAKQAAVLRERELAAQQRADELARYREVLRQGVDSLVSEEDFPQFIGRMLHIASEQLRAPVTEYWINDGPIRAHLVLTYRDGVLYEGSDSVDDIRVQGMEISPEIAGVETLSEQRVTRIIDMIENLDFREHVESAGMPVVTWCRERGVQKLILVPLLRSKRSYGALCIYVAADRLLEKGEEDMAQSLAQHVALAVRMTELAEHSKQTAVSRERELAAQTRAAELARANDVLRSTLERLSNERDLPTFPRTILRQAMEQTHAHDGVIFVLENERRTLKVTDLFLGPDLTGSSEVEYPPSAIPIDTSSLWEALIRNREPMVFNVEQAGKMLLPGASKWHQSRGNRSIVVSPIFVSGEPYGYFGLAFRGRQEDVNEVDLGLIQALTQQASLAIQLTRLAEESKQAELALEREKDAEERAAEFANANEVLRSTFDQLAKERDLHSFPRTILKEAINQTGANDGLILLFDSASDSLTRLDYIAADDPAAKAPPEFLQPFPASTTQAWMTMVETRLAIVFDVQLDAAMLLPGLAEWHKKRGNHSILAAPMFIGGEPYGYFGITLRCRASEVSKISLNLIHALAQQATLAIQLTKLAESSQQTAIALERQQVVVQERAHMAREIHDRLAQGYAAILMQQKALRRSIRVDNELLTPHLDIIEKLSKDNLAEARRTMYELKFDPLAEGSLYRALINSTELMNADADFTVSLAIDTDLPSIPRYVEAEISRVIGEALTNARRHSRAKTASVRVLRLREKITIIILDEGIGFNVHSNAPSFGIPSMHERAARAGADLEITSTLGCGTEVRVILRK